MTEPLKSERKERGEPGPLRLLDRLLGIDGVRDTVTEFTTLDDVARLREASKTAEQALLPVPLEARLEVASSVGLKSDGSVDPVSEARPYARLLLKNPYAKQALTEVLFPVERRVMDFVMHDPDLALLLNPKRTVMRNQDGNLVYPHWNSPSMIEGDDDRGAGYHSMLQIQGRYESPFERACPSNALWVRCFVRFLKQCHEPIAIALSVVGKLNRLVKHTGFGLRAETFETNITRLYKAVVHRLRRSLPISVPLRDENRALARRGPTPRASNEKAFLHVFSLSRTPAPEPKSLESERALQWCFLTAGEFGIAERYTFEAFMRVLVPAVLRTLRARMVFLHVWFPFTRVLQNTVYKPRGLKAPRDLDVWNDADADSSWIQYQYLEAYEFRCLRHESGPCTAESDLPFHRLTADTIVQIAKSMCVSLNYHRFQRDLDQARGQSDPDRVKAVLASADAFFRSDDMFLSEEQEEASQSKRSPPHDLGWKAAEFTAFCREAGMKVRKASKQ